MEIKITQVVDALNPIVGDLHLGPDGHFVVLTDLAAETAQRLFVRLNFFQGEWFADLLAGTPYYQRILKKAPSDRIIRAIFTQVIGDTVGIQAVTQFSYTVNRQRQLLLQFTAKLQDGSTFRSTDYPPFQVIL